ncbi:hypothetical protein H8E77_10340 [bacterium]|nr:hypothetical protein [bacterium]
MKVVIVAESGFLKDLCLNQSTDSRYLYEQIDNHLITGAIPEYAFAETDGGLQQQYRKQRIRLQETANLANELSRSQNLQPLTAQLKQLVAELQEQIDNGYALVKTELEEIRSQCLTILTNFEIFHRARLRALSATPPPDEIDCQIFETVLSFLHEHQQDKELFLEGKGFERENPRLSLHYDIRLFLTHDRKDFDYPEIHREINALGAIMVFSSSECLRILRERLP